MSTRGYVGRDVMLEYSLQPKDTAPESLVFVRLGMCQEKELNTTWDTVDATGDTSPNFTKENLVTFKSVAITGGYVSMGDDVENQAAFEDHIFSPPAETNYQPPNTPNTCLLYTSPSPRDRQKSRMPSSA